MRAKECPQGINVQEYSAELKAEEDQYEAENRQFIASLDEQELRGRLKQIHALEQLPKQDELNEIMSLYQSPVPIPVVYLDKESYAKIEGMPVVLHEVKDFCPAEHQRMEALAARYLEYLPQGTKLDILEVTDIACNKHYAITGIDAELAAAMERMFEVKDKAQCLEDKGQMSPVPLRTDTGMDTEVQNAVPGNEQIVGNREGKEQIEDKEQKPPVKHGGEGRQKISARPDNKPKPVEPRPCLSEASATQAVVAKPSQALQ